MKKDYMPELSFGTHFFQDLVEAKIKYLPLYVGSPGTFFNEDFFMNSPNMLLKIIPTVQKYEKLVRVISVSKVFDNSSVEVILDEDNNEGIAFIKKEIILPGS